METLKFSLSPRDRRFQCLGRFETENDCSGIRRPAAGRAGPWGTSGSHVRAAWILGESLDRVPMETPGRSAGESCLRTSPLDKARSVLTSGLTAQQVCVSA